MCWWPRSYQWVSKTASVWRSTYTALWLLVRPAKPRGIFGGIKSSGKTDAFRDVLHRVYLDNFDAMEKVDKALAKTLQGTPTPGILALRQEYEQWGIPRHPKKATQRAVKAEVQGAIVDGVSGCAYPKLEKVLKYAQLALLTVMSGSSNQKEMQVVAGGLVYLATFKRNLMGGLNSIWHLGFHRKFQPASGGDSS